MVCRPRKLVVLVSSLQQSATHIQIIIKQPRDVSERMVSCFLQLDFARDITGPVSLDCYYIDAMNNQEGAI